MNKRDPQYFEELKTIINNDKPEREDVLRMRWRKVDEHHIKSDKGFTISKTGDVYTCWAPANYRVRGVKIHTGYIGFFYTDDGKAAQEACQKLFAHPEDALPPEDGRLDPCDCGEVESPCKDQAGSVRIHRHPGVGEPDDTGHSDMFPE